MTSARLIPLCLPTPLFVLGTIARCQSIPRVTISGTVYDDSTSVVLQNVNVFIARTTLGSTTDQHGRFEIKNVSLGSYEIIASRVGYALRTLRVGLTQSRTEEVEIRLRPRPIQLGEVVVTAAEPSEWKKQLENFITLFLGESQNAKECKILNPEVLDFSVGNKGEFEASARAPLDIDNLALGYHLQFYLTQFTVGRPGLASLWPSHDNQFLAYAGEPKFTELLAASPEERERWTANRLQAYKGSLRHFLASLFLKELAKEGFLIQLMPHAIGDFPLPGEHAVETVTEDDILSDTPRSYEKTVHFIGTLRIRYIGKPIDPGNELMSWASLNRRDSRLQLNYEAITFNVRGLIWDWFPTKTYGDWARSRMADALPLDYDPEEH